MTVPSKTTHYHLFIERPGGETEILTATQHRTYGGAVTAAGQYAESVASNHFRSGIASRHEDAFLVIGRHLTTSHLEALEVSTILCGDNHPA